MFLCCDNVVNEYYGGSLLACPLSDKGLNVVLRGTSCHRVRVPTKGKTPPKTRDNTKLEAAIE